MNGTPNPNRNQTPQRPVQNGQRPMQNGQRPVQNGQRPMQNGQRPMQNGQRPMQNGQRPMQNGQRPPQNNGGEFDWTKMIMTAIIISVALVIVASITIAGALLIHKWDDWFPKSPSQSYNDDDDDDRIQSTQKPANTDKTTVVKAEIQLPCATPAGSYALSSTDVAAVGNEISSAAGILVDAKSNTVLAGKNANEKIYPASMTKVMTLLVACERAQNAGQLLTVEQWMIDYQQSLGASGDLGFKSGDQISVESALYLIIYRSDTISCLLIADYVAGSEAEFVALMNEKARNLGLSNTHFSNTTGLHSDDHYTTCKEMAVIMNCAMSNSVARKILTSFNGRTINVFINGKVDRNPTVYSAWYSDAKRFGDNPKISSNLTAIAGKTGYEDIPTACFVTVAKNSSTGKEYICVVVGRIDASQPIIGTPTSTSDTKTLYKNYAK